MLQFKSSRYGIEGGTKGFIGFLISLMREEKGIYYNLDISPPFQRASVWTIDQKVSFWESILGDIPIPPFVINENPNFPEKHHYTVIDGKQRIEAILGFLQGDFKIRGETWEEQSPVFKRAVKQKGFSVQTTRLETHKEMAEVYLDYLVLGVDHSESDIEKARKIAEVS